MKRRSFILGLSVLFAGLWPRGGLARPFGLRPVSGVRAFCTCPSGMVWVVVVAGNPGVWFEVMGEHEVKCGVNRMVERWGKNGCYLIPPCPQGTVLCVGGPVAGMT